jgi:hypothetical protein
MNITQKKTITLLEEWRNLNIQDRDKFIYKALFNDDCEENTPMFSSNIKDSDATGRLISKLEEYNVSGICVETLPRSTLAIVTCGDIAVPPMPPHKAIAYIGYLTAKELNEKKGGSMNVEDLQKKIENKIQKHFDCNIYMFLPTKFDEDVAYTSFSSTGEPPKGELVRIPMNGLRNGLQNGNERSEVYNSAEEAINATLNNFDIANIEIGKHSQAKPGNQHVKVYWRYLPSVDQENNGYITKMRFGVCVQKGQEKPDDIQ